jgi:hypothetical protein
MQYNSIGYNGHCQGTMFTIMVIPRRVTSLAILRIITSLAAFRRGRLLQYGQLLFTIFNKAQEPFQALRQISGL